MTLPLATATTVLCGVLCRTKQMTASKGHSKQQPQKDIALCSLATSALMRCLTLKGQHPVDSFEFGNALILAHMKVTCFQTSRNMRRVWWTQLHIRASSVKCRGSSGSVRVSACRPLDIRVKFGSPFPQKVEFLEMNPIVGIPKDGVSSLKMSVFLSFFKNSTYHSGPEDESRTVPLSARPCESC